MTAEAPPVPAPRKKGRRRLVAALTIVGVLALGWVYVAVDGPWTSAEQHHKRVRRRIDDHCQQAMQTFPNINPTVGMSREERGRYELLRAIRTALGNNPFYRAADCEPGKFDAIADRLDANNGADFQTFEGSSAILVMCDEASWQFHLYTWVVTLHEMEADGTIPKLPVLGKRWERDPRYLAYVK